MIGLQNFTIFGCYLSNKTKTQNIIAKSQSPSTRWLSNVHKLVPRPLHDSYNMYAPQFTSPQIVKVIWSSWQRSWSSILTLGWTMLWQSWWPWRLTKGAKKLPSPRWNFKLIFQPENYGGVRIKWIANNRGVVEVLAVTAVNGNCSEPDAERNILRWRKYCAKMCMTTCRYCC